MKRIVLVEDDRLMREELEEILRRAGYQVEALTTFADTAEQLLAQISDHDGEWNYLKGTICYRRGWVDEARRYYQTACQMDPGNAEYRQALNYVENGGSAYQPEGYEVYSTGCGNANLCGKLACAYLACNACSLGGIRYCYCC